MKSEQNQERPLIIIGSDGNMLRMQARELSPENWAVSETGTATVLILSQENLTGKPADLLSRVVTYVDDHMSGRITLKEVADHCGVSISTITQTFQKKTGETFHNYLTRRRMDAAEHLIRSGTPIEQVGKLVGYQDHSSFYRAFRQTFGKSPREYRSALTKE